MQEKCYKISGGKFFLRDPELGIHIEEIWDLPYLPDWKNTCHEQVRIEKNEEECPEKVYLEKGGRPHGEHLLLYPSGVVKGRSFYLDGVLHGPSEFYSQEGGLFSCNWFYKGDPIGESKLFYAKGTLYACLRYSKGVLEGRQQYFYEDGQTKTELMYQGGKIHGKAVLFWPSGTIKRECEYNLGLKHGKDIIRSFDGVVLDEGEFVQGLPVGTHRRRYENGGMRQEKQYHTPKKMSRVEWDEEGNLTYEGKFLNEVLFQETRWNWPEGDYQVREGEWDGLRINWK